MEFYIYENWQAGPRKAVIHIGNCGFCNNGDGRAGGFDPLHATWHGPFPSLEEVRRSQARLDVVDRKECSCVSRSI